MQNQNNNNNNTPASNDQIAEKLKVSLGKTLEGMSMLLKSLENSGFATATVQYEEMRRILILQKGWAIANNRKELDPLWSDIGKMSARIHQIMKKYADIMGDISSAGVATGRLATSTANTKKGENNDNSSNINAVASKILQELKKPKFVSLNNLSAALNIDKALLLKELESLRKEGILEKKGAGQNCSFKIQNETLESDC